jgi:hypothetical protein
LALDPNEPKVLRRAARRSADILFFIHYSLVWSSEHPKNGLKGTSPEFQETLKLRASAPGGAEPPNMTKSAGGQVLSEFRGQIEEAAGGGGTWVQVPRSVVEELGGVGRIPVRATFDGVPYRGSVVSMGDGGMVIGILKAIRTQLHKAVGEEVHVTLERDDSPREVDVPEDLAKALEVAGVAEAFGALSFTRRREIATGVVAAKRPETRQRRIEAAVQELK